MLRKKCHDYEPNWKKHCNFLVGAIPIGSGLGVYSYLMSDETEGSVYLYENIFCQKNVCLKTTRKS